MSENEIYRRPLAAYRRTWPQRLADAAPYGGLLLVTLAPVWAYDLQATPLWVGIFLSGAALVALGVERSAHYRGQRDRYRRSLVEQVRDCGSRHGEAERAAEWFEGRVPDEVLAEAFRTPIFSITFGGDHSPVETPASPRSVSEGCGSNHREAGDDV